MKHQQFVELLSLQEVMNVRKLLSHLNYLHHLARQRNNCV